ncbi:MAG: SDR family oxidoreductase [Ignavibacteriales bacterium]|nr:SDR family oxidoreductase [Ignavibacteriales bacterium]
MIGRIDILVNIAGITARIPTEEISPEQVRRLTEVNYHGTFWMCKEVGRIMLAQGCGNIVNMSALGGGLLGTGRGNAAYSATKGAIAAQTKELACEWGAKGIRVNAVAPGFTATEILSAMPEKVIDGMKARTPLGRLGNPRDIANAYLFLASDDASFITGETLRVDGGLVVGT